MFFDTVKTTFSLSFNLYNKLKFLKRSKRNISGRNHTGRLVFFHRGGGHKKHYRLIDFTRRLTQIPAAFLSYIMDPNRNALIALICYSNGFLSYILAPEGLNTLDFILSGFDIPTHPAAHSLLQNMLIGLRIHNLEFLQGLGGKAIRAGGCWGQLLRKKQQYAFIKLPSGEIRKIHLQCTGSTGRLLRRAQNPIKKAGRNRYLGYLPIVRGVAMNPIDHPHGGGEGKSAGGRPSVSPFGILTKGHWKTRSKKRSKHYLLRDRQLAK